MPTIKLVSPADATGTHKELFDRINVAFDVPVDFPKVSFRSAA